LWRDVVGRRVPALSAAGSRGRPCRSWPSRPMHAAVIAGGWLAPMGRNYMAAVTFNSWLCYGAYGRHREVGIRTAYHLQAHPSWQHKPHVTVTLSWHAQHLEGARTPCSSRGSPGPGADICITPDTQQRSRPPLSKSKEWQTCHAASHSPTTSSPHATPTLGASWLYACHDHQPNAGRDTTHHQHVPNSSANLHCPHKLPTSLASACQHRPCSRLPPSCRSSHGGLPPQRLPSTPAAPPPPPPPAQSLR
jgi:hypothetical protein